MKKIIGTLWMGTLLALSGCSYQVDQRSVVGSAGVRAQVIPGASLQHVNLISLAPINDESRISPEIVSLLESKLYGIAREQLGRLVQAKSAGKEGRVDAVVHLTLQQYQERQGGKVGAEQGAAVAFLLELKGVDMPHATFWKASYFWIDRPLTDNILQLSQKVEAAQGGFRTAQQLFEQGLTTAFSELNSAREDAFLQH